MESRVGFRTAAAAAHTPQGTAVQAPLAESLGRAAGSPGSIGRHAIRPLRAAVEAAGTYLLQSARARRGAIDSPKREHLDRVVAAFHAGYRHACQERHVEELIGRLSRIDVYQQGFAYEGAAMALGLLDAVTPWPRNRLRRFMSAADRQIYVVHVGAGWALARTGFCEGRRFKSLDPVLRWLAMDGIGFHDGYMRAADGAARRPSRRARLSDYAARVFDQGLGRSLWFTTNAEAPGILAEINGAGASRRPDLWSGVGLACAYAGGVTPGEIDELREGSGTLRPHLAQGVAFGAEARLRAHGLVPPHTEHACRAICGMGAEEAARTARDAALNLTSERGQPPYEVWRARLRSRFSESQ